MDCECLFPTLHSSHLSSSFRVITDGRLPFTILEGYVIVMGHSTKTEVPKGKIHFPPSDELETKIVEVEGTGLSINYAWSSAEN